MSALIVTIVTYFPKIFVRNAIIVIIIIFSVMIIMYVAIITYFPNIFYNSHHNGIFFSICLTIVFMMTYFQTSLTVMTMVTYFPNLSYNYDHGDILSILLLPDCQIARYSV